MYQLRDYQLKPYEVGVSYFLSKSQKPSIIVAPTAFGKSLLIAMIARKLGEGVLVIQPSVELLKQNYEKFTSFGEEASIYSASAKQKKLGKITYATIGSINKLGSQFKAAGYRFAIIDEVHLYPRNSASMFRTFFKDFGYKQILGLTATPFKLQTNIDYNTGSTYSKLLMLTDRNKHGTFFKEILHVTQIQELTSKGFWCPFIYEVYDFDNGKLIYNSSKSDFTEESIINAYKSQNISEKVIKKIEEIKDTRKSILVFVPSVADAIDLSKKVPNSAAVYSGIPDKERQKIINDFKAGIIQIIFNVNILSVGFDHQELDAIIGARPTASLSWYYQAMGRGSRIHPNKKDCLLVDFVNNSKRFGKLEDLYFKADEDGKYQLFGTDGIRITGIPLDEIGKYFDSDVKPLEKTPILTVGKYEGYHIKDVPSWYRKWMLAEFNWDYKTEHIKQGIINLLSNPNYYSNVETKSEEQIKIKKAVDEIDLSMKSLLLSNPKKKTNFY